MAEIQNFFLQMQEIACYPSKYEFGQFISAWFRGRLKIQTCYCLRSPHLLVINFFILFTILKDL